MTQGGQGRRGGGTEEGELGIPTLPSPPPHPPPQTTTASPQSQWYQKSIDSLQRVRTELTCYLFVIKARKSSQMEAALHKPWGRRGSRASVQSPAHPNPPDTLTFNQHALLALPFGSFYGNFIT